VVRFRQSGNSLSISAAGSPVTVTDGHCIVHTETPVEIHVPACRTVVEASSSR